MNLKTWAGALLVCGGLAFLGGCASMDKKDSTAFTQKVSPDDQVDAAYVAYVQENARKHDVQVYWINPPTVDHH